MKVIRDRLDARWLPSRFHFALFRLMAYFGLRFTRPEEKRGIVMAVQRDQNAFETFVVTICVLIVGSSFIASSLASLMALPVAMAVGFLATATFIQIEIPFTAAVLTPIIRRLTGLSSDKDLAVSSAILMLMVIAAATLLAAGDSPFRHVGTAFLIAAGANALASVAILTMERKIADAERRFGVEP